MKLLILAMITTWSFGGVHNTPSFQIVYSAEEAAIIVYQNEKAPKFIAEPGRHEYHLYNIDLVTKEIVEIPIPKVEFHPSTLQAGSPAINAGTFVPGVRDQAGAPVLR